MEGRLGKNFMERVKEAGFIEVKDKLGNLHQLCPSVLLFSYCPSYLAFLSPVYAGTQVRSFVFPRN